MALILFRRHQHQKYYIIRFLGKKGSNWKLLHCWWNCYYNIGQDILLHNWAYIKFFNHNFQLLLLHFSVDTDIIWCYMTLFPESVHSLLMSTDVSALWYEWKDKKGKIFAVCTPTSLWIEFKETTSIWLFRLDLSCPVVYKCCTYPTEECNWSRQGGSAGFKFEFLLCTVPKQSIVLQQKQRF